MVKHKGIFAFQKDIGRVRVTNEDQCAVALNNYGDVFLCVCDGMGGQNKGDYASKVAIDSMMEEYFSDIENVVFFVDHGTSCVTGTHILMDVPFRTDIECFKEGEHVELDRLVPALMEKLQ